MKVVSPIEILGMVAGFVIWASAFTSLYGLHGGACETAVFSDPLTLRLALTGIFVIHLAAHLLLCYWLLRRAGAEQGTLRFLRRASCVLSFCALGATLWIGAPVLFLRTCW